VFWILRQLSLILMDISVGLTTSYQPGSYFKRLLKHLVLNLEFTREATVIQGTAAITERIQPPTPNPSIIKVD